MAPLFQFNFDKPGPGVNPDEPRKTGYRRFEELLINNGGSFFKAGFLSFLTFLPFYAGLVVSVLAHQFPLMILAGLLGGMIAGPQITGLADTKGPEYCLQCGACMKHCPQKINIPEVLEKLERMQ